MFNIKPSDRADVKHYKIIIGDAEYHIDAQSLNHALRRAGDLRLNDTDIITVKLEQ